VNLGDPAFLLALALGVLGVVIYLKLQPPPRPLPHCRECNLPMERGEEIVDPDHPELRYIPGERQAYFYCPRCRRRVRARY